jgi:hypothetical protein
MAGNIKQHADGSAGLFGEAQGKSLALWGGGIPVAGGSTVAYHQSTFVKVAFGVNAGTAGLFSVVNPFPEDVYIASAQLFVTAGFGVGTAWISMGVVSGSSTDYGNNLIDSVTATAAGVFDNTTDKGTNGKSRQKWAAGTWVTGTCSQTPNTLAGSAFLEVVRP